MCGFVCPARIYPLGRLSIMKKAGFLDWGTKVSSEMPRTKLLISRTRFYADMQGAKARSQMQQCDDALVDTKRDLLFPVSV